MDRSIWDSASPAPAPPQRQKEEAVTPRAPTPIKLPDHVMSMGEVEELLQRVTNEIIELTEQDGPLARVAGDAKADWLRHLSQVTVRELHSERKSAQYTSEALAHIEIDPETGLTGNDLYRAYKTYDNLSDSVGRTLRAYDSAISALQTVSANLRAVTAER